MQICHYSPLTGAVMLLMRRRPSISHYPRYHILAYVAIIMVVPHALVHYLEYSKSFGVGGTVQRYYFLNTVCIGNYTGTYIGNNIGNHVSEFMRFGALLHTSHCALSRALAPRMGRVFRDGKYLTLPLKN